MKIYIGADHNGFDFKARLITELGKGGHEVIDKGSTEPIPDDDWPIITARTVQALLADKDPDARAILICGSGQGVCMAANRFKGIRASLVWGLPEAQAARNDDDSNVLCLPARYTSIDDAVKVTEAWLTTPFAGATRFKRRLEQLDNL
ncbi:MAG TPA: RpiB/LacA/LacB family sugar-phosphate isomerase [Nevskiaceae bacterium]|nr:RpiB/LacA/LacB family sugar-phosphate isomerase [Nevskiaceae bacterium]